MPDSVETPSRSISARLPGWTRFALIALLLHIPLFVYPVLRVCYWLDLNVYVTLLVSLPLIFNQIISRMVLRHRTGYLGKLTRKLLDLWLGASPVFLALTLVAEIVLLVYPNPVTLATIVIALTFLVTTFGVYLALTPRIVRLELSSSKVTKPVTLVQITDVHIGSRSSGFLERVVDEISRLAPDYLAITGDFIDATGVSEVELASLRRLSMPVYFTIGNHERYEDLDDILERLQNLGVKVLRNRTVIDRELQFTGIDDKDDAMQVQRQLAGIELDEAQYQVLLYHRPRGLEAAAAAGIDLMLSGHTHNGQIVPFNLIVGAVFEHINGLYTMGQTNLYVSAGTGTWGPVMRLGTRSEITLFQINPLASQDLPPVH